MAYFWFLILALTLLGHILVIRGLLNASYTIRMPLWAWNLTCLLHAAVGIAIGILLVERVGLHGARLFNGGSLHRVPIGWTGYGIVCLATLFVVVIQHAFPHQARSLISNHRRPMAIADGPRTTAHWAHAIPMNGIRSLELLELEIQFPNLPASLDGMSILHLTDLHFNGVPNRDYFERAMKIAAETKSDVIVLTGDILDRIAFADWLPATLGQLSAPLGRYFILGNHDAYDRPAEIRAAMTALGWTDLGGKWETISHKGHPLLLAGTEMPWLGSHPEPPPAEVRGAALRILLSHSPQYFRWAAMNGFDLTLAGHLHGGQIIFPLLGPMTGGRYHSGVFQRGDSVMHVSRGLGQIFPIRWRCPPEMTRLILRCTEHSRKF